ncbi:hypothetical protein P7C71_g6016, partial [Lecanoromycetidae sp. Uapishka_2]
MASSTSTSLPLAPPPWTCKATAYVLSWYNSASAGLPIDIAYDPLEANDPSFSSEGHVGTYKGGLCMAQVLRYSETPVGSYDELALLPGFWTGVQGSKKKDSRITGIWVSQEATLMNGRRNWNIPKRLARFVFTPSSSSPSKLKVEVFRSDPSATRPFFTASIQHVNYTPSFPFNSSWLGYLGISTHIMQPPLQAGEPADIVVGTKGWRRSNPILKTSKAKLVWFDMKQPDDDKSAGSGAAEEDALLRKVGNQNWWPDERLVFSSCNLKNSAERVGRLIEHAGRMLRPFDIICGQDPPSDPPWILGLTPYRLLFVPVIDLQAEDDPRLQTLSERIQLLKKRAEIFVHESIPDSDWKVHTYNDSNADLVATLTLSTVFGDVDRFRI